METIINKLFLDIGLEEQETEFGKLYHFKEGNQYSFWLVIIVDNLQQIISKQSDYFSKAKEVISNEWFDKNANLLILYKSDLNAEIEKVQIIDIEENPYLFKKQILFYKDQEAQNLNDAIEQSRSSIKKFFESKLMSNTIFEKHKNSLNNNDYESLLYRIAHKIPFLNIKVAPKDGLVTLIENNNIDVSKSSNSGLDKIISEIIADTTIEQFTNLNADEIYTKLHVIIDQNENT